MYMCICVYIHALISTYVRDGISRLHSMAYLENFCKNFLFVTKWLLSRYEITFLFGHLGIDFDHLQLASLMDPRESKIRVLISMWAIDSFSNV